MSGNQKPLPELPELPELIEQSAGAGTRCRRLYLQAAAWKETHDRIAAVLNDQQRAQFEQWRAQRGAGGKGMGPGPSYGPGGGYGPGPGAEPQN